MSGEHYVKATARKNTGHALSPRFEIKISDPTGNRTQTAVLEDRDFNHGTAKDIFKLGPTHYLNVDVSLSNFKLVELSFTPKT